MNGSAGRSGAFAELWELMRKELMTVGETAIAAASSAVKENIQSLAHNIPQAFSAGVRNGCRAPDDERT
jgi:hypothetical protein